MIKILFLKVFFHSKIVWTVGYVFFLSNSNIKRKAAGQSEKKTFFCF